MNLLTDALRTTARVFIEGDTGKIGRVAVRKGARGTGLGARLIEASIAELGKVPGVTGITTYLAFQTFSQEMLDEAFHIGLD